MDAEVGRRFRDYVGHSDAQTPAEMMYDHFKEKRLTKTSVLKTSNTENHVSYSY
jgi:hypothetical protein